MAKAIKSSAVFDPAELRKVVAKDGNATRQGRTDSTELETDLIGGTGRLKCGQTEGRCEWHK